MTGKVVGGLGTCDIAQASALYCLVTVLAHDCGMTFNAQHHSPNYGVTPRNKQIQIPVFENY